MFLKSFKSINFQFNIYRILKFYAVYIMNYYILHIVDINITLLMTQIYKNKFTFNFYIYN